MHCYSGGNTLVGFAMHTRVYYCTTKKSSVLHSQHLILYYNDDNNNNNNEVMLSIIRSNWQPVVLAM